MKGHLSKAPEEERENAIGYLGRRVTSTGNRRSRKAKTKWERGAYQRGNEEGRWQIPCSSLLGGI